MSAKPAWQPWHDVVALRDDVKSGELSLAMFAADLHDVDMGCARRVYQDTTEFFSLTFPTFSIRELARDVVNRLAGRNDKAVRQLELTYGGGKTHTLITLYHLVHDPERLPDLPAVHEFIEHIGLRPPRSRVAVLAFDKLDVEKGMEARDPRGTTRRLRHPWSVLAYQIAGSDGLRLLHAEDQDAERETAPAESLLTSLLALPAKEELPTLVLIDEVLMYARGKVDIDPAWRGRLASFFQYLTQAATKVDRCAIVASLLATDPRKSDDVGKEIIHEIFAIFRREREEGVQPVLKDDVAEVLRRRFFKAESIRNRDRFRQHVVAALKGIAELDEQTRKEGKAAEERFLKSYPFHPDLTDLFYSKWTNLENFQRTRGALRTFALALRDASKWDQSPLVGPNVFLGPPGSSAVSEAARELTSIATTEEVEGKRQEWTGILEGELAKAREIQTDGTGLRFRELEAAVFATFLHSQPIGSKALTRELLLLVGASRPDRIELEKALRRWSEVSWFLDEAGIGDAGTGPDGRRQLPRTWRLGSRPNLRQMHHDACVRVPPEAIDARLLDDVGKLKSLKEAAVGAGARVHVLPQRPRDVEDDGEFHYAVLGPVAGAESGKPSAEGRRFLEEGASAASPRIYRNAVVLAVPSREGIEIARSRIRDYLGWEEVRSQLKNHDVDPIRAATLRAFIDESRGKISEAIQHAYCIVMTVGEDKEIQTFKITVGDKPLFALIKEDRRSRIQETPVAAEALLPGGPYDLWREGETSRRLKDLVGAFAQFPHLPKMLNRRAILDTLRAGCREGRFVLKALRPDRSVRTFWRTEPGEADLKDPGLEVVLPGAAVLAEIEPRLLSQGGLPGFWDGPELGVQSVCDYFRGGHTVKVPREGYQETVAVPKAERDVVETAIRRAVASGTLWLVAGPASLLSEEIPAGLLTDDALLLPPPRPIAATDLLPENLPGAWSGGASSAWAIASGLSRAAGKNLPWTTVREALDGAFRAGLLERTADSAPWPCDFAGAQSIKLRVPDRSAAATGGGASIRTGGGALSAEASLRPDEIQDLAERVGDIVKAAAGHNLKLTLRVELGGSVRTPEEVVKQVSAILREINKDLDLE